MKTEVIRVNPTEPDPAAIQHAANVIKRGGLVAFPTETVYGLGACAFDETAVAKIFAAKGRSGNNPLIVHLASDPAGSGVADAPWPDAANRLAARFWPGPLTLVLPKPASIPAVVTAGGPTWAVRMPDHAVAHALIRAAGPLAAPSANLSTTVSPTSAEHVLRSLDGRFDLVLDGGSCPGGIESTVLDLTASPPRVLRPGMIRASQLREVIGEVIAPELWLADDHTPLPSPGTSIRHYAPRATLECYSNEDDAFRRVQEISHAAKRVCWLRRTTATTGDMPGVRTVAMPTDASAFATGLYDELHTADQQQVDTIVVGLPPDHEEWLAVRDRLRRATTVWK
jgi:L-threonylcarbamoyladenylate synthase